MTKQTFDQFPGSMWVISVPVATVWTSPESPREVDEPGVSTQADIDQWIHDLTHEESLALCDENLIQSQVLYGEPVLVTEKQQTFAHVVIPSQPSKKDKRGYPGWIPLEQLKQVNKTEWISKQFAVITRDKAVLENNISEHKMKLSYMTMLPVESIHHYVEVKTPHGKGYLPKKAVHIFPGERGIELGSGQDIVRAGEQFVHLSYFWGGMSAFGYDCSGLAYTAHKANGYQIARDASDQAVGGEKIAFDELLPGDLIFFAYEEGKGKLHHVGIYYGDGKMVHAPQTGKGVEIVTLEGTIYEKELCVARRYWNNGEGK
ncbi:C40 family peptidase [Virgibacillus sp. NKC19-16]|uniref:C40 family peptidase n=1 Tax=Virgibacillus salidurans TaxID=2831673 RepID=UPI001F3E08F4|nr:C40 family peptidase [Virgibacillus sp. NKC19-16]UJL45968.1 C40 family peptidase [Virgibacillus sp. NKC19-16]